jgi:urease accessory protein
VQNPTGGIFPGDRLHTRVATGTGTGLQLTGQSATQVYAGHDTGHDSKGAEQHYDFKLSAGSVLEHIPRNTVPHARSSYRQTTRISLAGDAVYLGWETVAAGRIGHGEQFAFDTYQTRTFVECDGQTLARDTVRLEPGQVDPAATTLPACWADLATWARC